MPSESKGQRSAGNAFGHLVPLLQRPSCTIDVVLGAGLVVLHQLDIPGKHGITIEKEARMHCSVNE